ncbi:MAG: 3-methyl-2-oxobutanoate hydroxymethyltransferase [Acidobacteriota bacterium]
MSATPTPLRDKVTVPGLQLQKSSGQKITALTAYDYPTARILDEVGIDIVLVGDSLAMTRLGYSSTLPLTFAETLVHLQAVRRGVRRALLIADLPYGSYHVNSDEAVRAALECVKKGGAEGVKLEGGRKRISLIERLLEAEIPVMGHIGLTPQSFHVMGGYKVQGKSEETAERLFEDALCLQEAGVFSLVLEGVPRELASRVTASLRIPTIGIGAGPDCDGQILVTDDLLGFSFLPKPKFVRQYANLLEVITAAVREYRHDCQSGDFPLDSESYHAPEAMHAGRQP